MFRVLVAGLALLTLSGAAGSVDTPSLDVVALLREFGFPIFVSVWFMWRLEKRLDRFTESIEKLYITVTLIAKTVDGLDRQAPGTTAPVISATPEKHR